MICQLFGEVVNSFHKEGKDKATTAVFQGGETTENVKVSTNKVYKKGEMVNLWVRVGVSTFKDKGYFVVVELDPKDIPKPEKKV